MHIKKNGGKIPDKMLFSALIYNIIFFFHLINFDITVIEYHVSQMFIGLENELN